MITHNQRNPPLFPVNDPALFQPQMLRCVGSEGDHQIWMDPQTSRLYEEYVLLTPSLHTYQKQMEIYEWRRGQHQHISRVVYVEELSQNGVVRELRVFVQKSNKLVKRRNKFGWNEGVRMLKNCLRGFEVLYRKFGRISVSDLMISLDQEENPKVWVNGNFARNTCICYGESEGERSNEEGRMVRLVCEAVEPYIEASPMMIKLRKSLESTRSFTAAYSTIELIMMEERTSGREGKSPSCQRKYFSKTPENPLKIDYKKQQKTSMKCSFAESHQNSYKYIPDRPNCLMFKTDSETGRKMGNKVNMSKDRRFGPNSKNTSTIFWNSKDRDMSHTPNKKSMLCFYNTASKTKRHYFGNDKQSTSKGREVSKDKVTFKESWSSNDLSFKSHKKITTEAHESTLKPSNLLERFRTKRTGSTLNRSPSPITQNLQDQFQSSQFFAPIAKSMTVIKKELEILNNLMSKDYTKQSTSDLEASRTYGKSQSRKEMGFGDFPNVRVVNQSIIQNPGQQPSATNPNLIDHLKSPMFNKMDDLKESQIIAQTNQEYAINSRGGSQSPRLPPKHPKGLKKLASKPMTQSITFDQPKSQSQERQQTEYIPTALDRFAKFRTESRIHEPLKHSFQGIFVAINQTPEEQF